MARPGLQLHDRLAEARESGRLNLSHLGPTALEDALDQAVGVRIAELDLSSNELDGDALSASLAAAFPRLRVMRLKYNRLASLPLTAVEHLHHLEHLDLDGNQIAAVDEAVLAGLPATLLRLSLGSNGLVRLPDGIGVTCCRGLTHLDVSNNPLTALPDSLGSCPMLSHLDVSSCRLAALPASLAQAPALQRFFCQNNELQRVPTTFGHLALKEWNLRANRLPLKYEQAKERGLAKFLAFLREEEEIERLQEIESNRPVGIASGPCMVFRCKAVLEDAVAAADAGEPTDGFAWIRHGYAVCHHRSSIYVWGGMVIREGRKTAELLVLNTDIMEWRVQPTRGERPCPRDGHAMVADDSGRHLLVFGGRKEAGGRRLAELHFLDLLSFTWFAPKNDTAVAPSPREQCTAAFAQGRLLIFGDRTNGARLNDLWAFDTLGLRWEQLPVHGTVPSPRQGAAACVHQGQLWVMGGQANFVLDDLFTYNLDTHDWHVMTIAGRSKAAARAGGHIITIHEGTPYMYGGRDSLGAQVSHLLKLKRTGPARFEWQDTEFCLLPNRSRMVLFDSVGRLCICQSGHPLHRLNVDPQQIEGGSVIWDVTQLVPLSAVKDKVVLEDASRSNPKQERIHHATLISSKLPPTFSSHTPREQQLLTTAAAFCQRWRAESVSAGRLTPCVALPNECGVPKVVCSTLRPTRLPHAELHDLGGISQFVAEFFAYESLERPDQVPSHLVSPWGLLEWQAGDSFDLATLACSLLLGAGYSAFVVVGYVPKQVALGDQSRNECPLLREHGLQAPPYVELPEVEASFEAGPSPAAEEAAVGTAEQPPASGGGGGSAEGVGHPGSPVESVSIQPAGVAAEGQQQRPGTVAAGTGYHPGSHVVETTPEVVGGPATDEAAPAADSGSAGAVTKASASAMEEQQPAAAPSQRRPKRYVHAFVLVKPGQRDVSQPLLLDPCTGCLYCMEEAPCCGIEFAWNAANFWCNLQCSSNSGSGGGGSVGGSGGGGRNRATCSEPGGTGGDGAALPHGLAEPAVVDWTFSNPNCWLPLLEQHLETATQLSMHSSSKVSADGPLQHFASSRLARLPSIFSSKGLSPRTHSFVGSAAAPTGALGAPAASTTTLTSGPCDTADSPGSGHTGKGGIALHLLATARNGTPRLGGWPAGRELVDSSLTYLSPDGSAMVQRSSAQLGLAGACSAPSPPVAAHQGSVLTGAATPAGEAAVEMPDGLPPPPEMLLSWVPALAVSRERLNSRCPRGEKVVEYRQARRELYARYGECQRWDGLVERLTTYSDPECSSPLCVLELFERRKDRLAWRQVLPAQRTSLISFEAGAAFCLRSMSTVRPVGEQVGEMELAFYQEARPDGLMRRRCSGGGMEEWFLPGSRPDGLVLRTVQYAATAAAVPMFNAAIRKSSDAAAILAAAGAHARGSLHVPHDKRSSVVATWDGNDRVVASIHEQYSPSAVGRVASGAVLERRFELASSELQLVIQGWPESGGGGDAGRLTRTYDLGGYMVEGAATPEGQQAEVEAEEQQREYDDLRAALSAAQAAIRAAEEETRGILASRQRQEQGTQLVGTAFYDATRVKVEDSDGMEAVASLEDEDAYDFLHHFLPSTGARDMTAAEAEEARAACLAAFDDRMGERHRVLACRLAESSAEVARLGAVLASELQHLIPADRAQVKQEEAVAAFRLQVAKRRAVEQPAMVAERRQELERRLAADKRLVAALAAGN